MDFKLETVLTDDFCKGLIYVVVFDGNGLKSVVTMRIIPYGIQLPRDGEPYKG